ncbi:hypothetical protein WKH56_08900 [Priestia sp. SB1]|uniref:Leucine-rich repeat domain-containing protein n=1 Tax=Priestia aryabhattai TaxID=412384 RepID=A0AAX6NE60_PRIAR|nr:hypothetical protein [Priestia aryabhattai]MDU9693940.1 hypothetical protein [Priestia aryabhattai]
MEYWREHTVNFEKLPKMFGSWFNYEEENMKECTSSLTEYLTLWHYNTREGKLTAAPFPESLHFLDLTWSNIKNFEGLGKFTNLKRLELHYCTKISSDMGLGEVCETLEHLYINNCKKFIPSDELVKLKNLRYLRLNSCGDLKDLSFLKELPNLIDFRFVDTNVLDGDLSPIVNHPTIESTGYMNKRHYNIKDQKMDELLKEKLKSK